jgi:hypothetical protein
VPRRPCWEWRCPPIAHAALQPPVARIRPPLRPDNGGPAQRGRGYRLATRAERKPSRPVCCSTTGQSCTVRMQRVFTGRRACDRSRDPAPASPSEGRAVGPHESPSGIHGRHTPAPAPWHRRQLRPETPGLLWRPGEREADHHVSCPEGPAATAASPMPCSARSAPTASITPTAPSPSSGQPATPHRPLCPSRARRQVYSETTMCQTAGSDCVTIPRGRRSAPGGEVMLRASDGAMGVSS